MRIKGPGGGAPPVDQASETTGPAAPTAPDGVAAPTGVSEVAPAAAPEAAGAADPVGDVARRLRDGEISPQQAVELLIDDAVERQVGGALADRREVARELKDLLRRYTESDPYLAAKVRRLGAHGKK